MSFEEFRNLLKNLGISIKDFAQLVGTKETTIYAWNRKDRGVPYWVNSFLFYYKLSQDYKKYFDECEKKYLRLSQEYEKCEKQLVSIKEDNSKLKQELEEYKLKDIFSTIQKHLLKDKLANIRLIELSKLLDMPLDNLKNIINELSIEPDKYGFITREDANKIIKFFISKKREDLRVHELANILGIKSKTILDIAHQLNIDTKAPSSKISIQDAKKIIDTIGKIVHDTTETTSKSEHYDKLFNAHAPLIETAQLAKIIPQVWEKLNLIEKKTNELDLLKKEIEELKRKQKGD